MLKESLMKKLIEEVAPGVIRVTTDDSRFYGFDRKDVETGLPIKKWKASITWISSFLVKDTSLLRWMANKGFDEAQADMGRKGARGSMIHAGCEQLVLTGSVKMEDIFIDKDTKESRTLTPDEYENVMFYKNWLLAEKPEILFVEKTVEDAGDALGIAGTVDLGIIRNGKKQIIDIKSGNHYMEHDMQASAYRYCLGEEWKDADMIALHLGRHLNKKGYRETVLEDRFDLFLAVRKSWEAKTKERGPLQRDFPLEIKLSDEEKKMYTPKLKVDGVTKAKAKPSKA